MAFCTSCGAPVTSRFCTKCGAPVGSAAPPAASPAAPAAPAASAPVAGAAYAAAPAKKKTSPVVWILVGIFGFLLLILIGIFGAGAYFVHKVKQNPAVAITRLLAATNPNIKVLSVDQGKGTITLQDKQTGKVVTMNFDDVKRGRISFEEEGKQVTLQAQGEAGKEGFEVKSPEGSVKFGAGASVKMPDWVPAYPGGTTPQSTMSMQSAEGESGSFHFTTKDPPANVLSFYEKNLKGAGFKITGNISSNTADSSGGLLTAEDEVTKRKVVVTVGTDSGGTAVNIMFVKK